MQSSYKNSNVMRLTLILMLDTCRLVLQAVAAPQHLTDYKNSNTMQL
jgi:hypothetical protein